MSNSPNPSTPHRITASAIIRSKPGTLRGMYVASTNVGTIQFFDGIDNTGAVLTGIITPAVGSHNLFDMATGKGIYAQITGTLDVMVSEWS